MRVGCWFFGACRPLPNLGPRAGPPPGVCPLQAAQAHGNEVRDTRAEPYRSSRAPTVLSPKDSRGCKLGLDLGAVWRRIRAPVGGHLPTDPQTHLLRHTQKGWAAARDASLMPVHDSTRFTAGFGHLRLCHPTNQQVSSGEGPTLLLFHMSEH